MKYGIVAIVTVIVFARHVSCVQDDDSVPKRLSTLVAIVEGLCGNHDQSATVEGVRASFFGNDSSGAGATTLSALLYDCTYGEIVLRSKDVAIARVGTLFDGVDGVTGCQTDRYHPQLTPDLPPRENGGMRFVCSISNLRSLLVASKQVMNLSAYDEFDGTKLSRLRSIMIILPRMESCPWKGKAKIGCRGDDPLSCAMWLNAPNFPRRDPPLNLPLVLHEIGHNLGLLHSGDASGNEYGDTSCAMGAVDEASGTRCFNAPQSRYLGLSKPLATLNINIALLNASSDNHEYNATRDDTYALLEGQCFAICALSECRRNHVSMVIASPSSSSSRSPSFDVLFSYRNNTFGDAGLSLENTDVISIHSVPYSDERYKDAQHTTFLRNLRHGETHVFRELFAIEIVALFEGYADPFDKVGKSSKLFVKSCRAVLSITVTNRAS